MKYEIIPLRLHNPTETTIALLAIRDYKGDYTIAFCVQASREQSGGMVLPLTGVQCYGEQKRKWLCLHGHQKDGI